MNYAVSRLFMNNCFQVSPIFSKRLSKLSVSYSSFKNMFSKVVFNVNKVSFVSNTLKRITNSAVSIYMNTYVGIYYSESVVLDIGYHKFSDCVFLQITSFNEFAPVSIFVRDKQYNQSSTNFERCMFIRCGDKGVNFSCGAIFVHHCNLSIKNSCIYMCSGRDIHTILYSSLVRFSCLIEDVSIVNCPLSPIQVAAMTMRLISGNFYLRRINFTQSRLISNYKSMKYGIYLTLMPSQNHSISYLLLSNHSYLTPLSLVSSKQKEYEVLTFLAFTNITQGVTHVHSCITSNSYNLSFNNFIFYDVTIDLYISSDQSTHKDKKIFFNAVLDSIPKVFINDYLFDSYVVDKSVDVPKSFFPEPHLVCNATLAPENTVTTPNYTLYVSVSIILLLSFGWILYIRAQRRILLMNQQIDLDDKLLAQFGQ